MKKFFITESDRNQIKSLYQTKGLLKEEYGNLDWDSGRKYLGEYINDSEGYGIPDGYGTMTYENNGGVHVGYFKNGNANGYGTYTKSDGDVYEGNWENDFMNGYWGYYIAIISVGGIVWCLWLIFSQRKWLVSKKPNAELTGRQRMDALPARRRIGTQRLAGKVASRWRSG